MYLFGNGRKTKTILSISIFTLALFAVVTIFVKAKEIDNYKSSEELPILTFQDEIPEQTPDQEDINTVIDIYDRSSEHMFEVTGTASYYGKKFHNRRTANGEKFDMYEMTAAHKKLPFGTILRVTNLNNDEVALVRINDRGPFIRKRVIDLSWQAAKEIKGLGLPKVKIEALLPDKKELLDESKDYFYGYSYSEQLICIPSELINPVDSVSDFEIALEAYNDFIYKNPEYDAFIFVPSNDEFNRENSKSGKRYIIGTIRKNKQGKIASN